MLLSRLLILIGICLILSPSSAQGKVHGRSTFPAAVSRRISRLTGTYTRIKRRPDENQSAILDVTRVSRSRIRLHLTALWWPVGRAELPHNGEIEATVGLYDHVAVYENGNYRLTLSFRNHDIVVTESGRNPEFGANISAAGAYQRTR